MPHETLKLIPGVDQNRTEALNEAAISDSNLIRFVPDRQGIALPQKLGGWQAYGAGWSPMTSVVRALHAWADTSGVNHIGVGTEANLLVGLPTSPPSVITPQFYTADVALGFTTTSGSSIVSVADTGSNVTSYGSIFIKTHVSVGGVILFGYYACTANTANSYSIIARNILGIPVNATSAVSNGGAVAQFVTAAGSQTVTVTLNNHGFLVGGTYPVLVATTVGGVSLSGNYIIQTVTENTFTITAGTTASSTATVSINGGNAQIIYYVGLTSYPPSVGYGAGNYGAGGYGSGVSTTGNRSFIIATLSAVAFTPPAVGAVATAVLSGSSYRIPVGAAVTVAGSSPSSYQAANAVVTASANGSFSYVVPVAPVSSGSGGTATVSTWPFASVTDWSLDNWGEDLIACPQGGGVFYWAPTSASFPDDAVVMPNAPLINEGAFVAMPARQVVAYGSTFTGIQDPMLVRWTDLGNFTKWVGTVTNQAGSYRISTGSRIVGGLQGPQQGLLWTDVSLWSMQYINLPNVYSFNEIASGCGLTGKKAAGVMAGVVYWMSQSQFFKLGGGGVETIPCPIWDVIFQEIDFSNANNIRCAPNSRFGEIAWYYPVLNPDGTSGTGEPTRYVKYNTLMNAWDYGDLTRTAWIDQSLLGPPLGAGISGGAYPIYQHERGNDADESAMNSYIQTGYFALNEGDVKSFLDQVWPNMKWGKYGSDNQNAQVQITFFVADYPNQIPLQYGPFTMNQFSTYITPRFRGRLVSIRVSSNDVGSFWRLGNIRYRFQPDGKF
jgi:hypothetical protein